MDSVTARPAAKGAETVVRVGERIVDAVSHVASLSLLFLTTGLLLGIVLRWFAIDNSWTYGFDLISLVWVAFGGAVVAAKFDYHVTAGIALETHFPRLGLALPVVRFVIVIGFLVLFLISGWQDTSNSYLNHETTYDVTEWPVWVSKAALPVGCLFWAFTEVVKFGRALLSR